MNGLVQEAFCWWEAWDPGTLKSGLAGATENARPENAGLENDGQLRKESQGLENAGLENDGPC